MTPGLRIDKWLWFARFAKTRGIAQGLVEAGQVYVNGVAVPKPSAAVKPGDVVAFPQGRGWRRVEVLTLGQRRGSPVEARALYQDDDYAVPPPWRHMDPEWCRTFAKGCLIQPGCARQGIMFDRIVSLIFGEGGAPRNGTDDAGLATAALLVEAASVDGTFTEAERSRIVALLEKRMGLEAAAAEQLLGRAILLQQQTNQLFPLTKTIVDQFSLPQRIELMEMMWEIVYADGRLHDYEANLVRRVSGLLYVPDQDSGAARQRALARLGISDTPLA